MDTVSTLLNRFGLVLIFVITIPSLCTAQAKQFEYQALTSKGEETSGIITATNEADAINQLRHLGLYPTAVVPKGTRAALHKKRGTAPKVPLAIKNLIATQHQTRQFWYKYSRLQDIGLPEKKSLETLATNETIKGPYELAIPSLIAQIDSGLLISESMAKHPGLFDPFVIDMYKAGELGGISELATKRIYNRLNQELESMNFPWFWCALFFVTNSLVVFISLIRLKKTSTKWLVVASLVAAMPTVAIVYYGLEKLNNLRSQERLLGTFGTLISTGVPILQSITITRDRMPEPHMKKLMRALHADVRMGDSVMPSFNNYSNLSLIDLAFIESGEETGQLPESFLAIAESKQITYQHHSNRLETLLKWLTLAIFSIYMIFVLCSAYKTVTNLQKEQPEI